MNAVLTASPTLVMLFLTVLPGVGAARLLLGRAPAPHRPLLRDRAQVLSELGWCLVGLAAGVVAPWPVAPVAPWWLAATATALVAVTGALRWRALPGVAPDARGRRRSRTRRVSAVVSVTVGVVAALAASGALIGR